MEIIYITIFVLCLLQVVKRLAPGFNPNSVMLDFEMANIQAIKDVCPDTHLRGCFFHFGQVKYDNYLYLHNEWEPCNVTTLMF